MTKTSLHTRRIVLSALFLAIALVLRTFTRVYLPVMGESAMRISFHGIFSSLPAILFGPVYGAMVSGLTDMVGHFISPSGAWLPLHTLHVAVGGFVRGLLWMGLKKCPPKQLRGVLAVAAVMLVVMGAYFTFALRADGVGRDFYAQIGHERGDYVSTEGMRLVSRMAITRSSNASNPTGFLGDFIAFTTVAPMGVGGLMAVLLALEWGVRRFLQRREGAVIPNTPALIIAMMVPAILVSTANTLLFRQTIFTSWQLLPFAVVWLPRVLQSIATTMINVFFVSFMLGLCEKEPTVKQLLK